MTRSSSTFSVLERPRDARFAALFRIAFFFGLLLHFAPSLLAVDVDYAADAVRLRLHNAWLYAHLSELPRALVHGLAAALLVSLVAGLVGISTRVASASAMALTWVFASFNALPVQTIALECAWSLLPVTAVFPGLSSTWSVDALLARRRGQTLAAPTTVANLGFFLVVVPFFAAGVEKLIVGWMTTNEMAMLFRTPPGYILRDVAFALPLRSSSLASTFGWFTIAVELLAPVLLCFRRTRLVGLVLWQALFVGIFALIEVPPLFPAIFVFGVLLVVDGEDLARWTRARAVSTAPAAPATRVVASSLLLVLMFMPVLVPASGCARGRDVADDVDAHLFVRDAVVPIEIAVGERGWQTLRSEQNDLAAAATSLCSGAPVDDVYSWQPAHARVDADVHDDAFVRKKGFFGSDSAEKPSLKLKWNDDDDARVRSLTLNNAVSDPSYVRQCLAYLVFERAGVPAPRCGFARVVVDGVDRGVYVNVESMKPPLFVRLFGSADGALYEGQLADFRPEMQGLFEGKDGARAQDERVIVAVTAALELDDAHLMAALDDVVDLDEFFRFWAVETVIAHLDGYANNRNNFFVWRGDRDRRLKFLPWGVDEAFDGSLAARTVLGTPLVSASPYASVLARGRLARRLFLHPDGRARYVAALRAVLHDAWDETALLAAVDEMGATLRAQMAGDERERLDRAIDRTRAFVQTRRAAIVAELDGSDVVWTEPEPQPLCTVQDGVDVTVATRDDSLAADPFVVGSGQSTPAATRVGARAGNDVDGRFVLEIVLEGALVNDVTPSTGAQRRVLRVVAPRRRVQSGAAISFGGASDDATALVIDVEVDVDVANGAAAPTPHGVLLHGALEIVSIDEQTAPATIAARVHGDAACVTLVEPRCGQP
jgi:hypothetical protein